MFFPTGRPNIEEGVGRANLNLAVLWLSCVFFMSLNSLKFLGSKHPEKKKKNSTFDSKFVCKEQSNDLHLSFHIN